MHQSRLLIVNADDFGLSEAVNRGIAQAHEEGIVTSASLMVKGAGVAGAVEYARKFPALSLGLHLDLGSWIHVDGAWRPLYEIVPMDDENEVAREVDRQIEMFFSLAGTGPTHLDSHQHVHAKEPARSIIVKAARSLRIPLRAHADIRYCGNFYGQTATGKPLPEGITVEALTGILVGLPEGITEIGCHPALGDDVGDPVYRFERDKELQILCNPRIRAVLEEQRIELRSFSDIVRSGVIE